ncbi:hypothetical protein GCM10007881_55240 [Mesorhizobium huakuii]|uniref:hypothetical protein n=1 Tax=Mesorhizobium huakuii TaxID=28104 RepID=UPI00235C9FA8|nr:hypothetical protein [Mesorhizobium huakuii]GLQ82003.1 hypothetical protein GCM10007881_55240 [Mesorhizobium huakuii]
MVKDISKEFVQFSIGRITIDIDTLISILSSIGFKEIKAKNDNLEFENVDDIAANKALIVGNPRVICDGVALSFSSWGTTISSVLPKDGMYEKALSLKSHLEKEKGIEDRFADISGKAYGLTFTLGVIIIVFGSFMHYDLNKTYILSCIPGAISLIILARYWYLDNWRKSVRYKGGENWLGRHWSQIVASAVTAVIVLVLTTALRPYIDKWF